MTQVREMIARFIESEGHKADIAALDDDAGDGLSGAHELRDALVVLHRVEHIRARLQATRIDAHIRETTHERISHNLKGERRKRAVLVRFALFFFFGDWIRADDGANDANRTAYPGACPPRLELHHYAVPGFALAARTAPSGTE